MKELKELLQLKADLEKDISDSKEFLEKIEKIVGIHDKNCCIEYIVEKSKLNNLNHLLALTNLTIDLTHKK